jgi:hypothetical protein
MKNIPSSKGFLKVVFIALTFLGLFNTSFADQSATVVVGKTVTIAIHASAGTDPMTYVWYKDGKVINGQTRTNFIISSASLTDSGVYSVKVSNSAGFAISDLATISVVKKSRHQLIITQSSTTLLAQSDDVETVLDTLDTVLGYDVQIKIGDKAYEDLITDITDRLVNKKDSVKDVIKYEVKFIKKLTGDTTED